MLVVYYVCMCIVVGRQSAHRRFHVSLTGPASPPRISWYVAMRTVTMRAPSPHKACVVCVSPIEELFSLSLSPEPETPQVKFAASLAMRKARVAPLPSSASRIDSRSPSVPCLGNLNYSKPRTQAVLCDAYVYILRSAGLKKLGVTRHTHIHTPLSRPLGQRPRPPSKTVVLEIRP